jgi:hypothetical protein
MEPTLHEAFSLSALCDVPWVASALGLAAFVRRQFFMGSVLYGISFVRDQAWWVCDVDNLDGLSVLACASSRRGWFAGIAR